MLSLFSVKICIYFFSISYTKKKCFCPLCCLDLICWLSYLPWKKILLTVFCGRLVFCGRWMCIGYYQRLSRVSYIIAPFCVCCFKIWPISNILIWRTRNGRHLLHVTLYREDLVNSYSAHFETEDLEI